MKLIYQWWNVDEHGSITIYRRHKRMGYHVVVTGDSKGQAPRIDNEDALALANAIYEDLGLKEVSA